MRLRRVLGWGLLALFLALVAAGLIAYWTSSNACYDGSAAAPRHPMKAFVYCDYGQADVLKLEDVDKPVPAPDEVLVKVRAAAVNPLDWHYMRGTPYFMRMQTGLRRPKVIRLGVDFAGTVEAAGSHVTQFKPGDAVFGGKTGAFAQYVAVRQDRVVSKPDNLSFEQAASVPIAAITALQSLRDMGQVQPGQKVLINGASGGVGTFAVQIAKSFGAQVTGVCSTRNVEMVRSLGADQVIDYKKQDYTAGDQRYDVILDNVGNRSLSDNRRVLAENGKYILVGGGGPNDHTWIGPLGRVAHAYASSKFGNQELGMFLAQMKKEDLMVLRELLAAGKVKPVIDRRYEFDDLPQAIRYLEEGHARGKVVIAVE